MKRFSLAICAVLALFGTGLGSAQEKGTFHAVSKTAKSVTGDVSFANERMSINFYGFPVAEIRSLTPAEAGAAFDADSNAGGGGSLFRLSIPAGRKFLHGNTLCGAEDTQWMATYLLGKSLQIAFFSGEKMPVLTLDAMANATNLCGTFTYAR